MNRLYVLSLFILSMLSSSSAMGQEQIPIQIHNPSQGAPITMGIPFPQGALESPDHVRLLDQKGNEIPCQTTMVTNWEPLDFSVKWMWLFFFNTGDENYILEYGSDVRKMEISGDRIKIKNAQRSGQTTSVDTGPLRFSVGKRGGGFIDHILLDLEGDGFGNNDTIVDNTTCRGSFLDLLDDLGIDSSHATVHRTFREKGSGPLHAIIRLEGTYTYSREDNRDSPFIIRIHLYAGKSYIRVYHTLTYTGIPDKHKPLLGQHENIALTDEVAIIDDSETMDTGWMEPNDRIAGIGLSLNYRLNDQPEFRTSYFDGPWFDPGKPKAYKSTLNATDKIAVLQSGPKPDRIPPLPNSSTEERIDGFEARITQNQNTQKDVECAEGWADLNGSRFGIGIGIRNFLTEYPKEIVYNQRGNEAIAYLWSPEAGPMSFARADNRRDQSMISNFAEGVTKTSEVVFFFHGSQVSHKEVKQTMDYFLNPPVPHASAQTYSDSKVYGCFAPKTDRQSGLERSLDYKFKWEMFNQHWEPWYGMFDYGDQKNYYFRDDWYRWQNNEPAIDFMYWLQFMRSGNPDYYFTAEAMSRHTMDVDNVHWPTDEPYYGETNESLDYWKWASRETKANPYLGIGRRHANQHWVALLSAHVWLQGWIASYYLTGYHRGLDIARLTADSHLRRIWGEHGLTGRRLYLSMWNLVEAWDATKDPRYLEDLQDRVDRLIKMQNGPNQYDNMVIDRYGYSQVYASHAMYKYYQLTRDEKARQSMLRHARTVRDNPPYNHEYESYFATIHSLLIGHEFTGDASFLTEAKRRAKTMNTDKLSQSFEELGTQKNIAEALEKASNLPLQGDFSTRRRRSSNWSPLHGLRVFGWTHIYNVPWLIYWLNNEEDNKYKQPKKP